MILREKITVEIACEGSEPARITFAKPRLNKVLENAALDTSTADGARESYSRLAGQILEVQGVKFEDGTELTADSMKSLDIPLDFMLEVLRAYNKATSPAPEAGEKKEHVTESSSA